MSGRSNLLRSVVKFPGYLLTNDGGEPHKDADDPAARSNGKCGQPLSTTVPLPGVREKITCTTKKDHRGQDALVARWVVVDKHVHQWQQEWDVRPKNITQLATIFLDRRPLSRERSNPMGFDPQGPLDPAPRCGCSPAVYFASSLWMWSK
jgi:hypothetical protein